MPAEELFGLAPGDRIHDYEIEAPLSRGSMGAVYRARNPEGTPVALKQLVEREFEARFEIEGRLLARLRHPRVVRVLDTFDDETGMYLVMDLIEGDDLGAVLRERGAPGLSIADATTYVRQACEALRYVHEQQIVHRDVKPQNLILSDGGIVLVDFGIAREYVPSAAGTMAIGTPLFMAPEVLNGGAATPRSDVFGLAATLWTLLAGSPPRYGEHLELGDGEEGALEEALRAALAIDPERRTASVDAFAASIGVALGRPEGWPFATSLTRVAADPALLESIVKTAAGMFDAAASSIALADRSTGELVYQSAWGAGADGILGVRLEPGVGVAGQVVETGVATAVADCRADARFARRVAERTGYIPRTMLVVPIRRGKRSIVGALAILDKRDGSPFTPADIPRGELLAELVLAAIESGSTTLPSM